MWLRKVEMYMSVRFSILAIDGYCTRSTSANIFCDKPRAWRSSFSGISASMARAAVSARRCASDDIFARSSENFLAIEQPFLSKLFQVFVVQALRAVDAAAVGETQLRAALLQQLHRRSHAYLLVLG